jgi:hypothetical protein
MLSEQSKILAYISRLNRELQEFAGCPGSLAEIQADLNAARARLRAAQG